MGDSDDEFERRRRDKFRGERSDYGVSGGAGGRDRREDNRRRDDWGDRGRDGWGGRDRGNSRRDYGREYGRPRERYSPVRHDMSPPMKRMRPEPWEERRYPYDASYGGGPYGNYPHDYPHPGPHGGGGPGPAPGPVPGPGMGGPGGGGPPSGGGGGGGGGRGMDDMGPTQPPMMSFKSFMEQCDDTISEEDALKKYSDYKLEFKRQQLNEFFINHKEEEWFKAKYHPEECIKQKEEQIANLKRRVGVFMELEDMKRMENITVDADQSDQLLKLLDSVVIKLEGGSDYDLLVLDQPPEEELKPLLPSILPPGKDDKKPYVLNDDSDVEEKKDEEKTEGGEGAESDLQKKAKKYLSQKPLAEGEESSARKRKRSDSGSSSSSDSEGEEPTAPPGMEKKGEAPSSEPLPPGMDAKEDGEAEKEVKENGTVEKEKVAEEGLKKDEAVKEGDENGENDEEKRPKALHKTASIFLRNLAPTITKQEVESMCRRYSGFLRAAIADPQAERRWFRRGWVTFKRDVNIKDICWNLNNIRLRDCELGAIVNRDLSRRIRTVNGITSHKAVVRSDIKLSAKIIQNLDSRWGIWDDANNSGDDQPISLSHSGNPVLRNITDYLIEEASAEEEELLGANEEPKQEADEKSEGETIQRDMTLIKVMDRLLLYLRIVHSVDYYNHSEYPNEDLMPNRCGIMHARGIPPSSKITPQEIQDYCRAFENKIGSFLQPLTKLTDEDAKKLGLKECNEEVEKFIHSNTQEVGKDKWQCPLCGKKFKAEEFVHKHILNKHGEKVKEVQKEVDYFNNYLRDPKRPQLPEYPGNKQGGGRKEDLRMDPYVASYPQQPPMLGYNNYGNRYPAPGPYGGYGASSYPKDFYNRGPDPYMREQYQRPRPAYRSRSGDPREVVGYHDLDAPEDRDVF